MQGLIFRAQGRWGHFRRPETNNTPLTHDFITKTAVIGLMGSVLGIERSEMRRLFPILTTDLVYGVRISGAVRKQSWAFTFRNANRPNDWSERGPRQMEFIRDPAYTVALCARDERSIEYLHRFSTFLKESRACYTPVLGIHNCPAELEWAADVEFSEANGPYRSTAFVLREHPLSRDFDFRHFRLGFERIPTYQNDDWWNLPEGYRDVAYPSQGGEVAVEGKHYRLGTGEAWCLI